MKRNTLFCAFSFLEIFGEDVLLLFLEPDLEEEAIII